MFPSLIGPKAPTVESIAGKSGQAMGIFQDALNLIDESNAEANVLARQNQDKIDILAAQNTELETLTDKNDKFAEKIRALLS